MLDRLCFGMQALKRATHVERPSHASKSIKNEGRELRIRVLDGNHTALQMFRSRLNDRDDVEYANYFQNHPDLDDPELYVRSVKGKKADKILKDICSEIAKELSSIKL